MKIPKLVYVCTPLSKEKFNLKMIQERILSEKVFAFIPPIGQLEDKHQGTRTDVQMLDLCDEVWVFGRIGRDCAWEIGYAKGLKKPVKFFMDNSEYEYLRDDWMVFHEVTNNECTNLYEGITKE